MGSPHKTHRDFRAKFAWAHAFPSHAGMDMRLAEADKPIGDTDDSGTCTSRAVADTVNSSIRRSSMASGRATTFLYRLVLLASNGVNSRRFSVLLPAKVQPVSRARLRV